MSRRNTPTAPGDRRGGSPWVGLACNVVLPALILTRGSGPEALGPTGALLTALAFPLAYGVREAFARRRLDLLAALGTASVLLTGGISLLGLPPEALAWKEAALPALFGLAVLGSLHTPWPLVRTLFYQGGLIDTEAVERAVRERGGHHHHLERVFAGASWGVAGAFFLSAALNFLLASTLVTADPGTDVYNEQLGRLTALSFPAIALPTTLALVGALWFLLRGLSRLSGLPLEALVRNPRREEEP